jgi:predicted O-linked N-acetylglucosamine transferase (SPINDLY family)
MKLNNGLLALWARLLAAVPDSRLVIRHEQLAHAADRDDLTARAVAAGIPAGRLAVAPPLPGTGKLLSAYSAIDIALDTHPYTGTTTLCEALLMGVPAVTLRGSTTPGRVGAAILTLIGLPDLIASTADDYIRIAAALAADRPRLEALRATLRGRFQASPLADGPAFAKAMERTLRAAHARFADQ